MMSKKTCQYPGCFKLIPKTFSNHNQKYCGSSKLKTGCAYKSLLESIKRNYEKRKALGIQSIYYKRYRHSEKGKVARKKYCQTEKFKASSRKFLKKYSKTKKYLDYQKEYKRKRKETYARRNNPKNSSARSR